MYSELMYINNLPLQERQAPPLLTCCLCLCLQVTAVWYITSGSERYKARARALDKDNNHSSDCHLAAELNNLWSPLSIHRDRFHNSLLRSIDFTSIQSVRKVCRLHEDHLGEHQLGQCYFAITWIGLISKVRHYLISYPLHN